MAVQPGTYNFTLQRRADFSIELRFMTDDVTPIDLTGWTAIAQIWNEARSTKYADFTVVYVDRPQGRIKLTIDDSTTANFPLSIPGTLGSMYYDVMLVDTASVREYYVEGMIFVSEGYSA